MPTSYVDIDRDEMEYLDGGMTLLVNRSFLDKNYCNRYASGLIYSNQVKGMGQLELAQEIYAHARLFYYSIYTPTIGNFTESIKAYLIGRAGVVNIEDYGDTKLRKLGYAAIWKYC